MAKNSEFVEVENFTSPGTARRVEARKYHEMRRAVISQVAKTRPGMTVAELRKRVAARLSDEIFPGGATAGWWFKCVQLDLEAKKIIAREDKAPVRLYLC